MSSSSSSCDVGRYVRTCVSTCVSTCVCEYVCARVRVTRGKMYGWTLHRLDSFKTFRTQEITVPRTWQNNGHASHQAAQLLLLSFSLSLRPSPPPNLSLFSITYIIRTSNSSNQIYETWFGTRTTKEKVILLPFIAFIFFFFFFVFDLLWKKSTQNDDVIIIIIIIIFPP